MKIFTTLILAFVLILTAQSAEAADKCKYSKDKADPFTKVHTRVTKWKQVTSTWMAESREIDGWIAADSIDDKYRLLIKLDYTTRTKMDPSEYEFEDAIVVLEGAPLYVLMADESVVKLLAEKEVRKDSYDVSPEEYGFDTSDYRVRAVATIHYLLDAAAMEALSSQSATNLRITAENRNFDIEFNKKSFDDIKDTILCIQ